MCGVICYSENMLGHLQLRTDNLIVNDLTLLRCSRLSLTDVGISLILGVLSEPPVMYKCSRRIIGL